MGGRCGSQAPDAQNANQRSGPILSIQLGQSKTAPASAHAITGATMG